MSRYTIRGYTRWIQSFFAIKASPPTLRTFLCIFQGNLKADENQAFFFLLFKFFPGCQKHWFSANKSTDFFQQKLLCSWKSNVNKVNPIHFSMRRNATYPRSLFACEIWGIFFKLWAISSHLIFYVNSNWRMKPIKKSLF